MISMTGFAALQKDYHSYQINIEIRSVNHKNNDIKVHITPQLIEVEQECLKQLKNVNYRGRVNASIRLEKSQNSSEPLFNQQVLLDQLQEIRTLFANDPNFKRDFNVGHILTLLPSLSRNQNQQIELSEDWQQEFMELFTTVLKKFVAFRSNEGLALEKVLEQQLRLCEGHFQKIQELNQTMANQALSKYKHRLLQLTEEIPADRLAQEAAILADKIDIDEEIKRFEIHIAHFRELMHSEQHPGRSLSFLCQELLREANTMASKSINAKLTQKVVALKNEIERIREQVQNIS